MRSKRSECVILKKMIKYCDEIAEILKKHNYKKEAFDNDSEFQFAAGMCIIQIGELVSRLDDDFVSRFSCIPWRQIKGMRNIYAHDYDTVDNEMVWETITNEFPELRGNLQKIFNEEFRDNLK